MPTNVWPGLELRHLVALQAVAHAGTFGRAARHLGYTQSAMSQQIASLEDLVGQRLIERARGQPSIDLTEAGRLLLAHADTILARIQAAHADFEAFGQGALGVLRVGTYQSVSTRILPALMREFSAAWPRVEVQLTEVISDDVLPLVDAVGNTHRRQHQGPFIRAIAIGRLPDDHLIAQRSRRGVAGLEWGIRIVHGTKLSRPA